MTAAAAAPDAGDLVGDRSTGAQETVCFQVADNRRDAGMPIAEAMDADRMPVARPLPPAKRFMRFGRSAAVDEASSDDLAEVESNNNKRFMRFGKRFMRFGRDPADDGLRRQTSTERGSEATTADEDDGIVCFVVGGGKESRNDVIKRFMRFGRNVDEVSMTNDNETKRFMRFGRLPTDDASSRRTPSSD